MIAAYPRLDFKPGFAALFADQAERKPGCRAAALMAAGIGDRALPRLGTFTDSRNSPFKLVLS